MRFVLTAVLLLGGVSWPFQDKPARLELVEASRVYAPEQAVQVRLTNRGPAPIYFITEVRRGVRTAEERRLPGLPVYERRKQKFFFRSDRWVYATDERARFRAATLEPNDSVIFAVQFSRPAKYKVHLAFWRQEDLEGADGFLKMDVQEIEKRYGRKVRWTSTPSFRVKRPPSASPKKR